MAPAAPPQSVQIALIASIIGLVLAFIALIAYLVCYRARAAQDEESKPLLSKTMFTTGTPRSSNAPNTLRTTDGTVDKGTNTDCSIKQRAWYEGLTAFGTLQQDSFEDQGLASTIKRKISRPILTATAAANIFKAASNDNKALTKPSGPAIDCQVDDIKQPNTTSDAAEEGPSGSKSFVPLKPSDVFKPAAAEEDEEANPWVTDLVKPTRGLVEAMKAKLSGVVSTHPGDDDQTIKAKAQNDLRRYSTLYTITDVAHEPDETGTHSARGTGDSKYTELSRSAPPGAFPVSPKEQKEGGTEAPMRDDKENTATKRKGKSKSSKLPRHRRQASKSEPNQDTTIEAKLGGYVVSQPDSSKPAPAEVTAGRRATDAKRQSSAPNSRRITSGGSSSSKSQSQRKRKLQKTAQGEDDRRGTSATENAQKTIGEAV